MIHKLIPIFILILTVFCFSCENDTLEKPPRISFLKKEGYIYDNRTIKVEQQIKVGIIAEAIGEDNELIKIKVLKNDLTYFDTAFNRERIICDFIIKHDLVDSINWKFIVYDKFYNSSADSIITLINKIPAIVFIKDMNYTYKDTILDLGESILVGINSRTYGKNIKFSKFEITKQNSIYFDTLIDGQMFMYSLFIIQDNIDTINWNFKVYDETLDSSSISLNTFLKKE